MNTTKKDKQQVYVLVNEWHDYREIGESGCYVVGVFTTKEAARAAWWQAREEARRDLWLYQPDFTGYVSQNYDSEAKMHLHTSCDTENGDPGGWHDLWVEEKTLE